MAKTLLGEMVADALVLIDEIDKAPSFAHAGDPYRPLYALVGSLVPQSTPPNTPHHGRAS